MERWAISVVWLSPGLDIRTWWQPFSRYRTAWWSGFKYISNVYSTMITRAEEMPCSYSICLPSANRGSWDPYHLARSQSRAIGVLLGRWTSLVLLEIHCRADVSQLSWRALTPHPSQWSCLSSRQILEAQPKGPLWMRSSSSLTAWGISLDLSHSKRPRPRSTHQESLPCW